MLKISVKSDVKQVVEALNEAQRKYVPESVAAALNRAVKQSHTAAKRELKNTLDIPAKNTSQILRHAKRDRATRRLWKAGIFGVMNIPAKFLGNPRQTKQGVKIGRHMFTGAFYEEVYKGVAHSKLGSGKNIYKRVSKQRHPVKVVRVWISSEVNRIVEGKYSTVAVPVFSQRFHHELTYRLKKRGLA